MGRKDEAEVLLREVAAGHPELHEIQYSLGLLLAEQNQFEEAARYLEKAAAGLPERPRVHYNLGLLLQHLKRDAAAEAALMTAVGIDPDNLDYLYALADFYLKRGKLLQARPLAERMLAKHPQNPVGRDLLNYINKSLAGKDQP
jgi:tetratricopeptide (TPR) repeat protein